MEKATESRNSMIESFFANEKELTLTLCDKTVGSRSTSFELHAVQQVTDKKVRKRYMIIFFIRFFVMLLLQSANLETFFLLPIEMTRIIILLENKFIIRANRPNARTNI